MSLDATVVAVVPTFDPDSHVLRNLPRLVEQCARVVVVDDGSGAGADAMLDAIAEQGAEVLRLARNGGIAGALNAGVRHALADPGTDFVLTVDQDSQISCGYVEAAVRRAAGGSDGYRVGIVVPATIAGGAVAASTGPDGERTPLEPIQSGMLIPRSTFESVGYFRDDFVIDCVDSEFFLRTRRAGLRVLLCDDCALEHELGVLSPSLPWRQGFAYHSPRRRYYMTRNRLTVLRDYRKVDATWFRHVVTADLTALALHVVFGPRRRLQVLAVLAGVRAFRKQRYGLIPDALGARLDPPRDHP